MFDLTKKKIISATEFRRGLRIFLGAGRKEELDIVIEALGHE
jgi:hypothetical protein